MSQADGPLNPDNQSPELVEHFFRHQYGRLVSSLVRKFGPGNLELIEDCVQSALMQALTSWGQKGAPESPAAWLHRVAHNKLIDHFRHGQVAQRAHEEELAEDEGRPGGLSEPPGEAHLEGEISDDELRMLFVCCDDALPPRTQLALALKILCGFSVKEIALRLLTTEEAIYKQLKRGRAKLAESDLSFDSPESEAISKRLSAVHQVLYLLFNEGYSSARAEEPIRRELCEEAIRLAQILVKHPLGEHPNTWALLALMHLHHARIEARTDDAGGLLLLEEQDRSLWDREEIHGGLMCLMNSAVGEHFSRYHAEAAVLSEHCLAKSYAETNWGEIVSLYKGLESIAPSPLHTLNRAIAMGEWKGPEAGLKVIEEVKPPAWLLGYYLWDATLGELHRRAGHGELAKKHLARALEAAPTDAERARIRKRLDQTQNSQ